MPSRPKAQARGEVISGTGGRASSKCEAAQDGRSGRRDRPTQAPSAQRARPWQSSDPTSSSQRRSKPRKLRNRLRSRSKAAWRNAAEVVASRWTSGPSWPSSSRSTVSSRARALSSVQYPSAKLGMV